jgi:hypothetical protein
MVRWAGGTHRLVYQHTMGGGRFQTCPHRAVTGMIGATTGGERVHISPESAGILPSQTRRGRDALTRRRLEARAAGPHCVVCRWNPSVGASAHHSGGGFQTHPHRAVTGMIGATTGGERVHISPGSAGRWPAWCGGRVDPIVSGGRFQTCPHYACGDGHDRCDTSG